MTPMSKYFLRLPRYQRVKAFLLEKIRTGSLLPGRKIPSELELAQEFGVSRMTINKAVHELVENGVLLRFAGDGTYVAESKVEAPLFHVQYDIARNIAARGHVYSGDILKLETVSADQKVAAALGLEPGQPVYYNLLLHHEDGLPVELEERYVNPEWAPEFIQQDFTRISPAVYIIDTCPVTSLEHSVQAVLPHDTECKHLAIPDDEPCLLILRKAWSHRSLITFARLLHPGSRFSLSSQTPVLV